MDNLNLFSTQGETSTTEKRKELSNPNKGKLDNNTNKQQKINNTGNPMNSMSFFGGSSTTYDQDTFNRRQEEINNKYDSLDDVLGMPQQEPQPAPVTEELVRVEEPIPNLEEPVKVEKPRPAPVMEKPAPNLEKPVKAEKPAPNLEKPVKAEEPVKVEPQVVPNLEKPTVPKVETQAVPNLEKPTIPKVEPQPAPNLEKPPQVEHTKERQENPTQEIPEQKESTNYEYQQDLHSDPIPPKKSFIKQVLDGDQAAEDTVDFAVEKVNYAIENIGKFAKDKFVSGLAFVQNVKMVKKFKQGDFVDYNDLRFLRYNNELMLYKYNGTNMSLEIPSYVGNLPVTQLNPGFLNFVKVKSVAKSFNSANIQYTSAQSLKDCVGSVKSIKLPNTLEVLPANVFSGCHNLRYIIVPASVRMVHSKTFAGCYPAAIYFEGIAPVNLEYCNIGRTKIFCRPEFAVSYANVVDVNAANATDEIKEILFGEMS